MTGGEDGMIIWWNFKAKIEEQGIQITENKSPLVTVKAEEVTEIQPIHSI